MDLEQQTTPLIIYESVEEAHQASSSSRKEKGVCNHIRLIAAATLLSLTGIATYISTSNDFASLRLKAMSFADVVYMQGDGYNVESSEYNTLGAHILNRDDIAFCEGSYVYDVSSRVASRGCVAVSHQDLFSDVIDEKVAAMGHYCIGTPGLDHLAVDFDMIKAAGIFEDPVTGYHSISQFSPGEDVEIVIFSGKNFDGQSAVISSPEDGRLPSKFFPDGSSANDNVQSFIIKSHAHEYFAGKDCGLDTQVCPVIISREDALADQPDGCALFTAKDASYEDMPMSATTIGVRICANQYAHTVKVNRKALTAMKMIHDDGDKESQISFLNEGKGVELKYYDSAEPSKGEVNLSPGSFVEDKYGSGEIVNDNVYSVSMKSTTKKVPSTC